MARTVEPRVPGKTKGFDIVGNRDYSNLPLHTLLSQPVPLVAGTISTAAPLNLSFFSHSSLFSASSFHLDKVRGYLGIRATVVVRLVINATKFTSGRLVLSYQPMQQYYVERRDDYRQIGQLCHVEADLATDTEVVLRIPHRGPYSHFDIVNKLYDTGVFRVTEYLPHRGDPFDYRLYISFEDIDLMAPTTTSTVTYESGLEVEEKKDVPVSQKIGMISSAATALAGVPMLSSFMAPLAWVSGVASGVLSAFGYSRPTTTVTPEVYKHRLVSKLNQTDGTDIADPLAMTTTASVRVSNQIGLTEEDEMSFAYLQGICSPLWRVTVPGGTASGTKIGFFPLSPLSMIADGDITNTVIMHPMAYIANTFHMYRGSISVTFDLSKTPLHSGRLMVVFEPVNRERFDFGLVNTTDSPFLSQLLTIDDAINCHKDIIDIRKGTSFTFDFPFTSFVPYLPVDRPYGFVHLFVLNEIVTSSAVAPADVSIGFKFKALPDMEYAGPSDLRYYPYLPDEDTLAAPLTTGGETLNVSYESGLEVSDVEIVNKPIGSTSIPSPSADMAALCIGEKILSMKQVAMRSKLVHVGALTTINRLTSYPFVSDPIYAPEWFTDPATSPERRQMFDFYSYVSQLYTYGRGGVVFTFVNNNWGATQAIGVSITVDDWQYPIGNSALPGSPTTFGEWGLTHWIKPLESDRVYVPPYQPSFVRYNLPTRIGEEPTAIETGNTTSEYHIAGSSMARLTLFDADSTGVNVHMYRSAADDTQFGGFRGVPHMVWRGAYREHRDQAVQNSKASSFRFPNTA